MTAWVQANSVHVHLSGSVSLHAQAVCVLENLTTYVHLCGVLPRDSCYGPYDSFVSLCVILSPPFCLLVVGHVATASSLLVLELFLFIFLYISFSGKYGCDASGKHHSDYSNSKLFVFFKLMTLLCLFKWIIYLKVLQTMSIQNCVQAVLIYHIFSQAAVFFYISPKLLYC